MTLYARSAHVVSIDDAQRGRGMLAKKYDKNTLEPAKPKASRAFTTYGRDKYGEQVAMSGELKSPPKLSFVSKKPTVFSLQKSLLRTNVLGQVDREQSPIRGRFSPIRKVDDQYYPKAQLAGSIGFRNKKALEYQQMQTSNYERLNKGRTKVYHSACFDAPYKGQVLNKEANSLFLTRSLSLSQKEVRAITMNIPFYQQDFFLEHRNLGHSQDTTKTYDFDMQTDRKQELRSKAVGKYVRQDNFNFDYNVPDPKKKLSYVPDFGKMPGRDGKALNDDTKRQKHWTTSQLYRSFSSMR